MKQQDNTETITLNTIKRRSRVFANNADRAVRKRLEALRRGEEMAMLDDHNNLVIVTDMCHNRFHDFLVDGEKQPRLHDQYTTNTLL